MPSRLPLRSTALSACLALGLSACATFTNTDVVADVAGLDVTDDEFGELSTTYFERNEEFGTTPAVDGRVDAGNSRILLTAVIRERLFRQFLAEQGIDNADVRADYIAQVIEPSPIGELDLSDDFIDLFAVNDPQYTQRSLGGVAAPNTDELAGRYADDPDSIGLVCVRHILVETEEAAQAVRAELAAGADFAELAAQRSVDTVSAESGGVIAEPGNECVPLETVRQGFDPGFVAGVLDGRPGVASEPVESSFGWHIILHRPWDEIGESVTALYQPDVAGAFLFSGFKTTAEVAVDPRYGTWNHISETVEPIG